MWSFDEVKADLEETQQFINAHLEDDNEEAALKYSTKMSQIIVWFMQNGYLED